MNFNSFRFCTLAALILITGFLQPPAHATSETEVLAAEIENIIPAVRAMEDKFERDEALGLLAIALARMGKFEAALQINNTVPDAEFTGQNRDEIWRITTRRLAWQGNIAAATRSANRIQSEYSRADAQLAIARAYLRASDSAAAQRFLNRAAPTIRATQSPRAITYLAYLFARTGAVQTARELFAAAKTIKDPNAFPIPGWPDGRLEIITFYQAKAGWNREALQTIGGNHRIFHAFEAVLTQKREWQPLIAKSAELSPLQAVNYLQRMMLAQLVAGDRKAAQDSWQLAQARFSQVGEEEQASREGIFTQAIMAFLEIALGDEAQGRAHFAELSKLPHFTAEHESTFYYFLVVPLDRDFSFRRIIPKPRPEDEHAAISALLRTSGSGRISNLLNIARAQQKRGDTAAMRDTLQLAREQIRTELVAPQKSKSALKSRRYNAAARLLQIAKIQQDAGDESAANNTLAQAMTLLEGWPREDVASLLLYSGFAAEAVVQLEAIFTPSNSLALDKIKHQTLNNWNPLARLAAQHARHSGAVAALRWVMRIPDVSLRSKCLTAIVSSLTPTPPEESELILHGDKKSGGYVSASIRIPGYGSTSNFDELLD